MKREDFDDMIPVEKWDGSCWEKFFERFCKENANEETTAWDILARFIKCVFEV